MIGKSEEPIIFFFFLLPQKDNSIDFPLLFLISDLFFPLNFGFVFFEKDIIFAGNIKLGPSPRHAPSSQFIEKQRSRRTIFKILLGHKKILFLLLSVFNF